MLRGCQSPANLWNFSQLCRQREIHNYRKTLSEKNCSLAHSHWVGNPPDFCILWLESIWWCERCSVMTILFINNSQFWKSTTCFKSSSILEFVWNDLCEHHLRRANSKLIIELSFDNEGFVLWCWIIGASMCLLDIIICRERVRCATTGYLKSGQTRPWLSDICQCLSLDCLVMRVKYIGGPLPQWPGSWRDFFC